MLTRAERLRARSQMQVEIHEGYIEMGPQRLGEQFIRAMVELADRLFPTGWKVTNGFVVPSNYDVPSRTEEWLLNLSEERAAKGLNSDGTRKKKERKRKQKAQAPAKQRALKRREAPPPKSRALKIKRRRK